MTAVNLICCSFLRISFPEVLNLNDFYVKTESTSMDGVTGQSSDQETANGTSAFGANCEILVSFIMFFVFQCINILGLL